MKKAIRTVVYDDELRIEAYHLRGVVQPFPKHFHDYYVIGLVEDGQRRLICKNQEYTIQRGSILLFNPGDSHACVQSDGGTLDYRGINISQAVMLDLAEEVTMRRELPGFFPPVISDQEAVCYLRPLHEDVMAGSTEFGREENLLLMMALFLQRYGRSAPNRTPECRQEIERACAYMEQHFAEHICLEQICRCVGLSKSTLLRGFAREKGVTPYNYLESIRIGRAKALLEQGASPVEAALATGYSDQSHFTNYFSRYIGLAPGAYREIFKAASEEHIHGT